MSSVSIVVPVYHNAKSLPDLLRRFQALAASKPGDTFEFIFVDDGSGDDSHAVLTGLARDETRMKVLKLSRNFGSNAALLAGLSQAEGEAVAVIAADLQDPPELIGEMLELWRTGRKVVLAERTSRDDPWSTTVLANTFYWLFRRFAIKAMPRHGFDFFLVDRQVCALINGIQESNAYLFGLVLWLGFNPAVVTYHRAEREKHYGVSMWTLARKVKYFIDSFVAFSYFPVRAASVTGMTLSALGMFYALFIIGLRVFYSVPVEGWSSLMVAILVVGGVQMVMMGILGEYLWRNLDESRKRPRFVIESVTYKAGDALRTEPGRAARVVEQAPFNRQ